jgi:hypothetical protein
MEEQSHQKKSAKANQSSEREWSNPRSASHANPRNIFCLDGEIAQENPNPQSNTPNQNSSPPSPPHQNHGGGRRGGRGKGRGRGRGHQEKRKWYCIFQKENATTAQTIARTRKDLRLPSKKRRRRKRGTIP